MPGIEELFKLGEQGNLGAFVVILTGFLWFALQRNAGLIKEIIQIQDKRISERDDFVERALRIRSELEEEIKRKNEEIEKSNEFARMEGYKEALAHMGQREESGSEAEKGRKP